VALGLVGFEAEGLKALASGIGLAFGFSSLLAGLSLKA
jgi:hypothetical protein